MASLTMTLMSSGRTSSAVLSMALARSSARSSIFAGDQLICLRDLAGKACGDGLQAHAFFGGLAAACGEPGSTTFRKPRRIGFQPGLFANFYDFIDGRQRNGRMNWLLPSVTRSSSKDAISQRW